MFGRIGMYRRTVNCQQKKIRKRKNFVDVDWRFSEDEFLYSFSILGRLIAVKRLKTS